MQHTIYEFAFYEGEKDMPSKISKFVKTIGVIDQV
jgi:hypothetical protein